MPKIRLTGSRLLFCDWETENCWGEVQNIRGLILAQYTSKNDLEVIHSLWGSNQGFLHVRRTLPTPLHPSFYTTPGYMSHNFKGYKISTHQNVALVLLEKSKSLYWTVSFTAAFDSLSGVLSLTQQKGNCHVSPIPAPPHPSLSESMAPSVVHSKAFEVTLQCPMSNPSVSLKDTANIHLDHINLCLTSGLHQQQRMEP